jgi:hypothetical protein
MLRWDHSAVQVNVAPKDEESPRHAKGNKEFEETCELDC